MSKGEAKATVVFVQVEDVPEDRTQRMAIATGVRGIGMVTMGTADYVVMEGAHGECWLLKNRYGSERFLTSREVEILRRGGYLAEPPRSLRKRLVPIEVKWQKRQLDNMKGRFPDGSHYSVGLKIRRGELPSLSVDLLVGTLRFLLWP